MAAMLGIDVLITAIILILAAGPLMLKKLRQAVLLFLLFCIFMSLVWVRLGLLGLAAAELVLALIMTGIVLWYALGFLPGFPAPDTEPDVSRENLENSHLTVNYEYRPSDWMLPLTGSLLLMGLLGATALSFYELHALIKYKLYTAVGILTAGVGFYGLAGRSHLLRRVFGLNVLGSGVFLQIASFSLVKDLAMDVVYFMVVLGLMASFLASLLVVILMQRPTGAGNESAGPGVS